MYHQTVLEITFLRSFNHTIYFYSYCFLKLSSQFITILKYCKVVILIIFLKFDFNVNEY